MDSCLQFKKIHSSVCNTAEEVAEKALLLNTCLKTWEETSEDEQETTSSDLDSSLESCYQLREEPDDSYNNLRRRRCLGICTRAKGLKDLSARVSLFASLTIQFTFSWKVTWGAKETHMLLSKKKRILLRLNPRGSFIPKNVWEILKDQL